VCGFARNANTKKESQKEKRGRERKREGRGVGRLCKKHRQKEGITVCLTERRNNRKSERSERARARTTSTDRLINKYKQK